MKLLVSPVNLEEAGIAVEGGADIIDVKNPREGSLGANFPWVIQEVRRMVPPEIPVSATIGDFDFKPGTASLAAMGAALSGASYVKVGLFGVRTREEAVELIDGVARAVKDKPVKVVVAAYSDHHRINSLPPLELPEVAVEGGAHVIMVDTAIKDGSSTLQFMDEEELSQFTSEGHSEGMEVALAGAIKMEDLPILKRVSPDILGVRGCVCGGDRNSTIKKELVVELKNRINS